MSVERAPNLPEPESTLTPESEAELRQKIEDFKWGIENQDKPIVELAEKRHIEAQMFMESQLKKLVDMEARLPENKIRLIDTSTSEE